MPRFKVGDIVEEYPNLLPFIAPFCGIVVEVHEDYYLIEDCEGYWHPYRESQLRMADLEGH